MSGLIKAKAKAESGKYRQTVWRPKPPVVRNSVNCPHCNHPCDAEWDICPECGHSLRPGKCTFCGAQVDASKKFCTHCGQPKEGIICPKCEILNSRNFCRKCNAPLTPRGQTALKEALSDSKFQDIKRKAEELDSLYRQIEASRNSTRVQPDLSDDDQALLDRYNALFKAAGISAPSRTTSNVGRQQYIAQTFSLDDIMAAYREKAAEMDAALAALIPPPDFTPEQQRDYYSARKIAYIDTQYDMSGYSPMMWRCNVCSALHPCPSDCVSPELGGQWIYITPEQYNDELGGMNITQTTLKIE